MIANEDNFSDFSEFYYTHIVDIFLASSESRRGEPVLYGVPLYTRRLAATFGAELDLFFSSSALFFFLFLFFFSFYISCSSFLFLCFAIAHSLLIATLNTAASPIIAFPSPRIGSATHQGDH